MGGKSSQSTQSVSIPPAVLAQYQSVNAAATQTAQTPFQQYSGQFVAPVNNEQSTGISSTNATAEEAQPYYTAATGDLNTAQQNTTGVNNAALGLAGASAGAVNAQPLTGADINKYMSPYLQDVVGSESALLNQNNQQQQAGQLGTAITSGAFGSDRTGLAAANLEQQQNLANANIYSGLLNTGYNTALSTAQQQQGVNLSAAQANRTALANAGSEIAGIGQTAYGEGANTASELGSLGAGAQTAGLQGANAQIAAGTVQQQTQQAQDTAEYNQFLQQQSYPFQVDQFLANIAEGTGSLSGSTTTTTQPGGFFSDKRLKHDIKKIGKTYDGQAIYSYKMHGDPRTHIGLIAQNVEKKHPEAMGLAAGFKTVDYGKATKDAANRGHFYEGGVVPLRHAVGYDQGGSIGDDEQAILAAQRQMYQGVAGGGGNRQIPNQPNSHQLTVASGSPAPAPSGSSQLSQSMGLVNQGRNLYKGFNSPSAAPASPAAAPTSGAGLGAADTSAASGAADAGAADAGTAAASAAAPAAADAAGTAAATAGTAVAGGAAEAGADAAAAAVAEAALADAGMVALAAAKGGKIKRQGLDAGGVPYQAVGANDPYSSLGGQLDVPDDENSNKLLQAGALKKQPTGLQTLMSLGNPDTASSVTGSVFSNQALRRGGVAGRIGKDDGGGTFGDTDPTLDPDIVQLPEVQADVPTAKFTGVAPETVAYTGGVNPSPGPSVDAGAAPDNAAIDTATGVAGGSGGDDKTDKSWLDKIKGSALAKPENLVPVLNAIAAMGTAPTRHLGVALAAGLGAGAQSYYPTQEAAADVTGKQLQNQRMQYQLAALRSPGGDGGGGGPPPMPTFAGTGSNPAAVVANAQKQFAFKDIWTPQEQANLQHQQKLQQAGLPNTLPVIQAVHTARMQNQQTSQQQGASAIYDAAYDAASSPKGAALAKVRAIDPQAADEIAQKANGNDDDADGMARTWASQVGNAVHKYSGRGVDDKAPDGIQRDAPTTNPLLGATPIGMSAEQQANWLTKLYGSTTDTGANAKPTVATLMHNNGVTPPASVRPVAPGSPGYTPPGATPQATAAPTSIAPPRAKTAATSTKPAAGGSLDFSDAPPAPRYAHDPSMVLSDAEKPLATTYGQKEAALKAEANELPQTEQSIIKAQRALALLPHAKTGPGTDTMSAIQTALGNMTGSQFTDWLGSNPSAHALLQKTLGTNALETTLSDMKERGAAVRLGNQESKLIIGTLSASTEMPKNAIKSLLNWQVQQGNYDMARQAAIPQYLAQGKDATLFDSYYAAPGKHPLSSALTTDAPSGTTVPKASGGAPTAAIQHLKAHPELADQFKAKYGYLP